MSNTIEIDLGDHVVVEIDGRRRTFTLPNAGAVTADQMNQIMGNAFAHLPADQRPYVLTPEEEDAAREKHARERRPGLIATIRSYPEADVKQALAAAKRKGWGLDGMDLEKLEEVARWLRVNEDDEADH